MKMNEIKHKVIFVLILVSYFKIVYSIQQIWMHNTIYISIHSKHAVHENKSVFTILNSTQNRNNKTDSMCSGTF